MGLAQPRLFNYSSSAMADSLANASPDTWIGDSACRHLAIKERRGASITKKILYSLDR
jgi:hypothetical protein